MKHFIVTRFNLRNEKWRTAKDGNEVLTEDWLEHRFKLFQTYCLPSVLNQSNSNFIWCIFFDINTSDVYRKRIKTLIGENKQIFVSYIDGMRNLSQSFIEVIRQNLNENDRYIITTRLDNDDLIHEKFVETVQRIAKQENDLVIDIRSGYQVTINNGVYETRKSYSKFNPFLSLVESTDNYKTIMSKMHMGWEGSSTVFVYNQNPLWIEFVHEKNKLNSIERNSPLVWKPKFKEFGIDIKSKHLKLLYVIINNIAVMFRLFIFFCKEKIKCFIKKKYK